MTAPESTPREAVARALADHYDEAAFERHDPLAPVVHKGAADAAATALLAGDWLERVLAEHWIASLRQIFMQGTTVTCACGWSTVGALGLPEAFQQHAAHQAAMIREEATR